MKVSLVIIGVLIVILFWPLVVSLVLGAGAGVLGALEVVFVAFVAWYLLAACCGKTKWSEISSSSQDRWGVFYCLVGLAGGIVSYIYAKGDFFSRFVPLMGVAAVALGTLPVWMDRMRCGERKANRLGGVGLTADGRIVRGDAGAMSDLEVDLDISAPVRNEG